MATELLIEDRREKAAELLSVQGVMSLAELVQQLGVSESTVRRDLEVLERGGVIKRTHGGAVYVKDTAVHSYVFDARTTTAIAEKEAIARTVAELVVDDQTVVINGGTTCYQIARSLRGRRLSVITNSVPIASLLSTDLATEVTLIGGYVYPRTGVALGATAEQMLDKLHAGQLVLSCAGITDTGAFNANQMMVDVERKMMAIADQVILAVDHSKFDMRSVVRLCGLGELDVIVTDSGIDRRTRSWLDRIRAKVIYADVQDTGILKTGERQ